MELSLLYKHFWAVAIILTFVNGAIWWLHGIPHRKRDPSLTGGYLSLIRGFVLWGNIPWLIMGAGILFGGVPSTVHYFDPRYPNPFVAAFFGSVFFIWIMFTYWIFARGGAEQLIRHPGGIFPKMSSPLRVKALWVLCLAGGIFAFVMMYLGKVIPPFS